MENNKKIKSQEVTDWSVDVKEDGSVEVTQILKTVYTQSYRDFLSDFREMEKNTERAKEILTKQYQEKVRNDIKKMQQELKELKPFIDEADKKAQQYYEKKQKEQMIKTIKNELNKPMSEINTAYISSIWDNIKENYADIIDELEPEEREKFQKIKLNKIKSDKLNERKKK